MDITIDCDEKENEEEKNKRFDVNRVKSFWIRDSLQKKFEESLLLHSGWLTWFFEESAIKFQNGRSEHSLSIF